MAHALAVDRHAGHALGAARGAGARGRRRSPRRRWDRGRPVRGSWDLLVNATPVGTAPGVDDSPLPDDFAFDGHLVYDLVYNPPRTRLLRDAAAAGCRILGGLEMLVAQAQAQFEWWTGQRPDADVMRAAALERLAA